MKYAAVGLLLLCLLPACSGNSTGETGTGGTEPDTAHTQGPNPFERGRMTQLIMLDFQQDSAAAAGIAEMGRVVEWMHNRCAWQDASGDIQFGHNSDSLLKAGVQPPVLQFMDGRRIKDLSFERVTRIYGADPDMGPAGGLTCDLSQYRNRAGKWREFGDRMHIMSKAGVENEAAVLAEAIFGAVLATPE